MILLRKNFEGKSFTVSGHSGVNLDCMFFPCVLDDAPRIETEKPNGQYLDKPTIIMCNPNALVYQ
jgi:hypothetical protein